MEIIKNHYNISKSVINYDQIKTEAEKLKKFIVTGPFQGHHQKCYAIHHSQVSTKPFNFFVVHPDTMLGETPLFQHRVMINPKYNPLKIQEPSFIDYLRLAGLQQSDYKQLNLDRRTNLNNNYRAYIENWPKFYNDEGCMSFPFRAAKRVLRYSGIEAEYQIVTQIQEPLKIIKTSLYGLGAQIFQHEVDHALGRNIYFTS